MNKPVHLGLSILNLSKILSYEFWYDYVKQKEKQKRLCEAKLFYMDTNNFIVYIKTDDIYKYIAEGGETRIDTSNYELECNSFDRPVPKETNKKVLGLMKDKLGGKIMTKFFGLRAKIYSYLIDDSNEDNKPKDTKEHVIKTKLNLKIIKTV